MADLTTRSLLERIGLPVGAFALVAAVSFFGPQAGLNAILAFMICAFGLALASRDRILQLIVVLAPTLPLLRRIASGDDGRIDSDPLAVVLLVLTIVVLVSSRPPVVRSGATGPLVVATCFTIAATLAIWLAASPFSFDVAYQALIFVSCLLLVVAVGSGRLPDVWPKALRIIPPVAVAVALYGIYQFFYLPEWDYNWMLTADLASIGRPEPLALRVFGTAESPGPFAAFLGLVTVLSIIGFATSRRLRTRLGWFLLAIVLTVPVILTGVRATLVGIVICSAVLALRHGRGFAGRLFPLVVVGLLGVALAVILPAFESTSNILSSDRYTDLSDDNSLQSRIALYLRIANPLTNLVGDPSRRGDGLLPDVVLRYGALAGLLILVLLVLIVVAALRNLRNGRVETAALCSLFIVVQSFAGNIFVAGFGFIAAIILGTNFHAAWVARDGAAAEPTELAASDASSDGVARGR